VQGFFFVVDSPLKVRLICRYRLVPRFVVSTMPWDAEPLRFIAFYVLEGEQALIKMLK
jgi:hypothetical protein